MSIESAYRTCHMHIMHSYDDDELKKGKVTVTCVMATVIHEPTGYYGADYISAIYEANFCRTYTESIPWSDIYGAGQTHMIPLRACGITGVTQ